jgi:hypothetical protein
MPDRLQNTFKVRMETIEKKQTNVGSEWNEEINNDSE